MMSENQPDEENFVFRSTPNPIKTCDYCGARGEMPTFRGGDTCCINCLISFAAGNTETRRREHELKKQIAALETELTESERMRKVVQAELFNTATELTAHRSAVERMNKSSVSLELYEAAVTEADDRGRILDAVCAELGVEDHSQILAALRVYRSNVQRLVVAADRVLPVVYTRGDIDKHNELRDAIEAIAEVEDVVWTNK